ncbi:dienelactone hydrolase family protein [Lentisphaera marina]|uniref:dienelactone hydrolase family protein n=1 Tax=Lentisphaera marina TaxID=1111041 RepID=UPI00236590EB|nr:acetylxylan esterase [Lentisphaera marina]MDD7984029.1 dienelactone hydrolase family protein [Lentisphaera marina]
MLKTFTSLALLFALSANASDKSNDSLPPLSPQTLPADIPSLWATFDSEKDPLETQVLHEYEKNGVTVQMISYVVGTFKGKKVRMGGYLAYPIKNNGKLPGIVQIHGGGQRAMGDYAQGIAQNGYAVLATNWGGRLMEHQEKGKPGEGKIGTDWAPLDATQKNNAWYAKTAPGPVSYDDFESPRNNNWFLINMANKRAITLLQKLNFVDANKIGVHGHSMGGKLSVMLAGTDKRVKVAVPSCGGTGAAPAELKKRKGNSARPQPITALYAKYIDDAQMLPYISAPIMYNGPQNDFNGMMSNMAFNWQNIPSSNSVRYSISSHLNHRHAHESSYVDLLMFEQYLKGTYQLPKTPEIKVDLKGDKNGPIITLIPDGSQEIDHVQIFYSQDPNGQFRFNRTAKAKKVGNKYIASAPILSKDLGFFAMANVFYKHPKHLKLQGPRWNAKPADTFILSTNIQKFEIPEVQKADPVVSDQFTRIIEKDILKADLPDWYAYSQTAIHTRKIRDPKWRGPIGAKLSVDVLDPDAENLILELEFNSYSKYGREYAAGLFYVVKALKKSNDWQRVEIDIADLKPLKNTHNGAPKDWQTLDHLTFNSTLRVNSNGHTQSFRANSKHGKGRQMRNIQWIGGQYPQTILMNGGGLELSSADYEKQFNDQIEVSIELEEKVDGLKKAKEIKAGPSKKPSTNKIKATPINNPTSSTSSDAQLPAPWQSKNIGAAPVPGTIQMRGGKLIISGSGADGIGKTKDSFNFVFREFEGDGSIVVRINAIIGESRVHFDFYGLMFRESLEDNSPMFSFAHTLFRTCAFLRHSKGQVGIGNHENGTNHLPIWLKITRSGNDFTASYSADNNSWTEQYKATVVLPSKLYIGMFSTSSKDENASSAEFSDFKILDKASQPIKASKNKKQIISI